ncbi:MAG: hypothetical protein JWP97_3936 [Labilithrix sp.]|nr:hypothetical protein [Labilithrix sp.]
MDRELLYVVVHHLGRHKHGKAVFFIISRRISMSALLTWVVAASSLLAPAHPHDQLAEAIATRATAEAPLFKGDEDRLKTSALLVAIAFRESSLRANAVGDHVAGKPTSFCAFQIHVPGGARTADGWTGPELAEDPDKCVTTALHMLRESMQKCPAHPLAFYASGPSGCDNARAQRISRDRLAIAQRLIRDVKQPKVEAVEVTGEDAKESLLVPTRHTPVGVVARRPAVCGGA